MSIKIINDVFDNSEMRGNDRLVMLSIADNADEEKRQAWPSVSNISHKTRIPIRTVWRCIKRCVASGELKIIRSGSKDGGSNLYEVIVKRSSRVGSVKMTGVPECDTPPYASSGTPPMPPIGTLTVIEPSVQPSREGRFAPPSLEMVKEHGAKMNPRLPEIECISFHAYYESNGWVVGRVKMKSWTAAMVNWRERSKQYGNARRYTQENPRNIGVCQGTTDYAAASKRNVERQRQESLALEMARHEDEEPPAAKEP